MLIIATASAFAQQKSLTRDFFQFKKSYENGSYKMGNARFSLEEGTCSFTDSLETFLIYWKGPENVWLHSSSEKTANALGAYFDCQYRRYLTTGETVENSQFNTVDGFFRIESKTKTAIVLNDKDIQSLEKALRRFFSIKWKKSN